MIKKICLFLITALTAALASVQAQAAPYADYPYLYEDFENKETSAVLWDNVASYGISDDGYAKSAASLRVTVGGDGQIMHFPVKLEAGKTYNLSCYVKPEGNVQTDELDFIFWLNQRLDDGAAGKEGYRITRVKNLSFKDGEWTKVSARFTWDGKAALNGNDVDALGDGKLSLRFGSNGRLSEINGKSSFTYYVDDLCVEPVFEASAVPDNDGSDDEEIVHDGTFTKDLGVYWIANGSETALQKSDEVPGGDCTAESSLHVTQESARKDWAYQNISIKQDTEYKLSFRAKGVGCANDKDITEYAVMPVFKNVSDGERYEIRDDSLKFTTEWKYYEISYTTPSAIDTSVQFYLRTSNNYVASEFYITDIKLAENTGDKEPEEYTTPEIRKIETEGYLIKNNTVTVNAEYLGPKQQTGLVQFFKQAEDNGGWASIKTGRFDGGGLSYTFTENDIGQNIKVRIVPMDIDGAVGGYREAELGRVLDSMEISAEFTSTPSESNVSAKATVANWSDENKSVVCILMLYDKDNACIGSVYKSADTSFGTEEILELSAADNGSCTKAKLFIWEGKSDIDTSMTVLKKSIVMTK